MLGESRQKSDSERITGTLSRKRKSNRSTCGSWTFPECRSISRFRHGLDGEVFDDGLGFDGSTIRGWQAINESDMLVLPEPETAFVDPFTRLKRW